MRQTLQNASSGRLVALALGALLFATLLFAKYRQPDTATLQIVGHALSSPAGTDSSLYMQMGEQAFREPDHRIFPKLFFSQHQKFIYPPSSLFLIEALDAAPSLHLSSDTARLILLLASWIGTILTGVWFYRVQRPESSRIEEICIALLAVLFLPIAEALYRGQIQLLLTFLWGLAALLWCRDRHGWSGLLLAVTCAFKPQLALFLVWGLLRKEWRFTSVFATVTAVIAACSLIHFGFQNNFDYLAVLSYLSRHGEALWANQSVNGLLNRLLSNGDPVSWNPNLYPPYRSSIYLIGTGFSALCVLTGLLLPWRKGWGATTADFLFFGCISVIASPIAWEHHYGYFFFLLVYLLARVKRLKKSTWALLVCCTLAMSNRIPPLDHRMQGFVSLFGAYLLFAGIMVLTILVTEEQKNSLKGNMGLSDKTALSTETKAV
jgi:hypothetical protein